MQCKVLLQASVGKSNFFSDNFFIYVRLDRINVLEVSMADALMLSRLGMGGFGSDSSYNGAFDTITCGNSFSDALNLNTNNSIFSGLMSGINNDFYGGMSFNPSFGGMGLYGMTPAEIKEWKNLTTEEKQEKLARIQENTIERQAERQERLDALHEQVTQRREERRLNRQIAAQQRQNYIQAPSDTAKTAAVTLKTVIQTNRKDEVMEKFGELKAQLAKLPEYQKSIKNADGTYTPQPLDDKEMTAKAREFYAKVTGCDLIADIDTNLSGSFTQGLKKGLSLGILSDNKDADILTEEIVGLRRDGSNVAAKATGRAIGGAVTVGAGTAIVGAIAAGATGGSVVPGVGTAIGAGVGLVIGLCSLLWS